MFAAVLRARPFASSLLALGAALGSLTACSEAGSAGLEAVASDERAILFGEASGVEDDEVVQVVAVTPTVTYRCTGTLVAHNLVVTARHCVSDFEDLAFTCNDDGELTPSSPGGRMKALYQPTQVSVHIGSGPKAPFGAQAVEFFATETPSICRNDIALILLDRELSDLPIAPIRLKKGTVPGEELRVVGYGADENRMIGMRRTRSGLTVTQVGPSEFRDPGDNVPPRTFVTEGPTLCIGDSGGPAFADESVVAGVWSQVVGDCMNNSARNYFTEVAPFAKGLVLPAFEAAGAEPWLEGTSGPGAVGTGGVGAAGDTSSAGEGASETGGAGGSVDTGGTGGLVGTGGLIGTGGDSSGSGAPGSGGTGNLGGGATSGEGGDGGGLRKKGGCTCGVVGTPSRGGEFLLVPLAAFALLRRRRSY